MKTNALLPLLFLFASCSAGIGEQTLTSWTLQKEGSDEAISVTVPTTVAAALDDNGLLGENLFVGDNYFKQDKSQFDQAWTFATDFRTPCDKDARYTLQFNGLNFYADITLNGTKIASSDTTSGVFIRRTYDITPLARKIGKNHLELTLRRAQKGDLNIGFVDWNPRPLGESMGIVGDVILKTSGDVTVSDAFVKPHLNTVDFSEATIDVDVTLDNLSSETVSGTLALSFNGGTAEIPVNVPVGGTTVKLTPGQMDILTVSNPRVWWTWDLGTPELYDLNVSFSAGGKVSDSREVTFGIREITSEVIDNHRQFFLNGRRILVKGAGWTDELFLRDTHETNLLQARYVKDMNMNCIRFENIWGKDDDIYECCDRLGLLAMVGWSCQWEWEDYCGLPETHGYGCINDEKSIDMAVKYFHDQVIRLHNHPSIICWLTGSDRIPNAELERRYMEIYGEYEYRSYVCSAKDMTSAYGGPSGTKMEGPYDYIGPDYWYTDVDCGGAFGFNTETGIGLNIPQLPSLKKMIPQENLWPQNKLWDLHCTASSSAMNSTKMLDEVMDAQYGKATTLVDYVNRAHAIDYDATRSMYEAFRCNVPVSTGIIQWMLNSAWPSLYWQLYDYYFVPTAAYYGTKKACEPLQLIYNYKEKAVYALNESGSDRELTAVIKVYDVTGTKKVSEDKVQVKVKDNTPVKVQNIKAHATGIFLALELVDAEGNAVADNFYCLPAKDNEYDWKHSEWYYTPINKYADMSFVTALSDAKLELETTKDVNVITVKLTNNSGTISYQNILQLTAADGTLVTPAFWSDNFVTVLPGQTKTVTCLVGDGVEGEVILQSWNKGK